MQDESHFLKNMKTARCKAALPLLKVLLLSLSLSLSHQLNVFFGRLIFVIKGLKSALYGGDNRLSVISLKYPKKQIKVNLERFLFTGF